MDFSAQRQAAKWDEDIERRKLASKAIDYYNNEQKEYLLDLIKVLYPKECDVLQHYIACEDLTQTITDEKAICFQKPCTIEIVDGSDPVTNQLTDLVMQTSLHRQLIQVDRYAELLGKVGVCPRWHPDKKYVILDIITPDRCYVMQDEYDHSKAKEVWYHVGEMVNSRIGEKVNTYYSWTDTEFKELEVTSTGAIKKVIRTEPNPYKRIPIAWFTLNAELDEFWLDDGYPLIDANEWANLRLTNLGLMLDYQTFSTLFTAGLPEGKSLDFGMTHHINIPVSMNTGGTIEGTASYLTPAPLLTEYWKIYNEFLINVARRNKLSAQSFQRDASSFTSGYQLKLSKMDVIAHNVLKREFYRESIKETIRLMMECYSINTAFQFPTDADIKVDFAEITFDQNEMEKAQIDAIKLSNGTTSKVLILMEENPDLTEDDAKAKLLTIVGHNGTATTPTDIDLGI